MWRDDLPVPIAGLGDVIVAIGAAGVNNTDINTRVDWHSRSGTADDASWGGGALAFSRVQGIDGTGRIVAVGQGVDTTSIGERALTDACIWEAGSTRLDRPWFHGSECDGVFTQYCKIAARHAHAIITVLSDAELASFPCSYSTAENMLTRAQVSENARVLITGASGGIGSAAIQLCVARGAVPIALSTPAQAEALRAVGAAEVLDRSEPLLAQLDGESVDVVLDLVGGEAQFPHLLEALRPDGRLATAGAVAGPVVPLDLQTLYRKDFILVGATALEPDAFSRLGRYIETGAIAPMVAKTLPLREITAAQTAFAAKGFAGKIVLTLEDL